MIKSPSRPLKFALILILSTLLVGCGAKVGLRPDRVGSVSSVAVVLPVVAGSGVQRERAEAVREILKAELGSSGYIVLDDHYLSKNCADSVCSNRTSLKEGFGPTTFFALAVDSSTEVNFLAGYYNSLSGSLTLTDVSGEDIGKISNTIRERGGLVFESGQVLQGIASQIRNQQQDQRQITISRKLVRSLVTELPKPSSALSLLDSKPISIGQIRYAAETGEADLSGRRAQISRKAAKPILRSSSSAQLVCVNGSPGYLAFLNFGNLKSSLREVGLGNYCGRFSSDALKSVAELVAEIRSPYGTTATKRFSPRSSPEL